jgi:hypothetical protein
LCGPSPRRRAPRTSDARSITQGLRMNGISMSCPSPAPRRRVLGDLLSSGACVPLHFHHLLSWIGSPSFNMSALVQFLSSSFDHLLLQKSILLLCTS